MCLTRFPFSAQCPHSTTFPTTPTYDLSIILTFPNILNISAFFVVFQSISLFLVFFVVPLPLSFTEPAVCTYKIKQRLNNLTNEKNTHKYFQSSKKQKQDWTGNISRGWMRKLVIKWDNSAARLSNLGVVYFDQHLGAEHSKRWSKQASLMLFCTLL